jgi:hypothetical protein
MIKMKIQNSTQKMYFHKIHLLKDMRKKKEKTKKKEKKENINLRNLILSIVPIHQN